MVETATKLKLKLGEIEFEIEGNAETVAKEREEFHKTLLPLLEGFMNKKKATYIEEPSMREIKTTSDNSTKLITCTCEEDSQYVNFAHFLKEKGFNTDVDRVIAAVYYLSEISGKEYMTKDDIEQELKNARIPALSNLRVSINSNIKKAHMEELNVEENKKCFRILQPGIKYCENYSPKEVSQKKSSKPTKTKATKDYPSLSITPDDLHIEKYCDITILEKVDEQLWVLLYMYTNETPFSSFTKQELQKIMKEKFGLPLTNDQVRRFFENAGANVDKIKAGKEHSIKLLQGGKKIAEEIINNYKQNK